jgi:hypothetical protein
MPKNNNLKMKIKFILLQIMKENLQKIKNFK